MKRGGRLSPSSKARLAELPNRRAVREAVFARDGGCLAAGLPEWGECWGPWSFHHVEKRGPYSVDNGITLCIRHNDMVEDEPNLAKKAGFWRSSHHKIRGCE